MKKVKKSPFERKQKGIVAILWVISVLWLFTAHSGCKKHLDNEMDNDCECFPSMGDSRMMLNCNVSSFLEGVSTYSNCNDLYIIIGIALDANEYGRSFKLFEDLKGNFPTNMNTFSVWGDGATTFELNRMDDLRMYGDQDVLIMLLTPARDLSYMTPEGTWIEKPEDFTTITCTKSVLKFSDGYVTGYLTPVEGFNFVEQKMKWSDFQKELHKLLNTK